MKPKKVVRKVRRESTPEEKMKRRASHWRRTGVGEGTIKWMRDGGWL